MEFQSSPSLTTGCNISRFTFGRTWTCFNPHPVLRPGATRRKQNDARPHAVSILTQSYDRVQLRSPYARCSALLFQSSPSLTTGCNDGEAASVTVTRGFNPHPVLRPGATCRAVARPIVGAVSILTQSYDRVQLGATFAPFVTCTVSILTQSYDRVQRKRAARRERDYSVSILTQSYDRVQRSPRVDFRPAGRPVRVASRKFGAPEAGYAVQRGVWQRLGAAIPREPPQVRGVAGGSRPS